MEDVANDDDASTHASVCVCDLDVIENYPEKSLQTQRAQMSLMSGIMFRK
jgi:hypothetical protein